MNSVPPVEQDNRDIAPLLRAKLAAGGLSVTEALWRFLESRRGQAFCAHCLSGALNTGRRIDRAIMGAEGRGASRRYGPCVMCGKDRLVCGLSLTTCDTSRSF